MLLMCSSEGYVLHILVLKILFDLLCIQYFTIVLKYAWPINNCNNCVTTLDVYSNVNTFKMEVLFL